MFKPEHVYGFPARLSLPKGTEKGYPLQWFVIITAGVHHQPEYYGPVIEELWQTYQPHHYQVVEHEDYEHFVKDPIDKVTGAYQAVEVVPDFDAHVITEGIHNYSNINKI